MKDQVVNDTSTSLSINEAVYTSAEKVSRQIFVRAINTVCRSLGITVEWLSDFWVARLEKDGRVKHICAYTLPLNDVTPAFIMRDKVATFMVLTQAGIVAVPHLLVRMPSEHSFIGIDRALGLASLPLVIKPCTGESGGLDVVKCNSRAEVERTLSELAPRYRVLAVCPFEDIASEYRVVVLDGVVLLIFEKVRSTQDVGNTEWRHNLSLGAKPLIQTNPQLCQQLNRMAQAAMQTVGARFAAVDIIRDVTGTFKVLEMNGGVTLSHFSAHSPEYEQIANSIYEQAMRAAFA